MMNEINITKIRKRQSDWISKKEAAAMLHCTNETMRHRVREMEALEGKRYPIGVTSQIGSTLIIDRLALNDYVRYMKRIKAGLIVPPYNPVEEARLLGYADEEVKDD